jgi:hypothetical protein
MQAELMSLHPLDRLEELNELLAAATRVGVQETMKNCIGTNAMCIN